MRLTRHAGEHRIKIPVVAGCLYQGKIAGVDLVPVDAVHRRVIVVVADRLPGFFKILQAVFGSKLLARTLLKKAGSTARDRVTPESRGGGARKNQEREQHEKTHQI